MIPEQCVAGKGIPDELMSAMDVRGIVKDTSKIYYIIAETVGMYLLNSKASQLASDLY
jgi:hypothetical protein